VQAEVALTESRDRKATILRASRHKLRENKDKRPHYIANCVSGDDLSRITDMQYSRMPADWKKL